MLHRNSFSVLEISPFFFYLSRAIGKTDKKWTDELHIWQIISIKSVLTNKEMVFFSPLIEIHMKMTWNDSRFINFTAKPITNKISISNCLFTTTWIVPLKIELYVHFKCIFAGYKCPVHSKVVMVWKKKYEWSIHRHHELVFVWRRKTKHHSLCNCISLMHRNKCACWKQNVIRNVIFHKMLYASCIVYWICAGMPLDYSYILYILYMYRRYIRSLSYRICFNVK